MAKTIEAVETQGQTTFGAGNLKIVDTPTLVTISFDPRVVIGTFSSGNPKVCSTGAFLRLPESDVKVMLHCIGKADQNG